jgi:putative N6-adenine-specific DNA methylase
MLPDYDKSIWRDVRKEAKQSIQSLTEGIIKGSDISSDAVNAAFDNCAKIDKQGVIRIKRSNVFDLAEIKDSVIVCNPPYGIRMNKKEDLSDFYKEFGDFLKQNCTGSTAYIYFGERSYIKKIGLKPSWKMPLNNGGLDGRLVKFELY